MDAFIQYFILVCLIFSAPILSVPVQDTTTAAPTTNALSTHKPGGEEHIVIIDKNHPTPPAVAEVLSRLDLHERHPDVRHVFNNSAFQGFAASMKLHCLDRLANMSDISMVEKAVTVSRADVGSYNTRPNAPWGLQRISTSNGVGGNPSAVDYTYSFADSALGKGSDVYILDTGIYTEHNVFNGRASMLWSYDNDMNDHDGHGTHVAGTAAGDILGVASNANIFGIKAISSDGSGWSSDIVAAIDYTIQRHESRTSDPAFTGSVISMSLGSAGPVNAIDAALASAISVGIHACVAAGNSNTDACESSPAASGGSQGGAITVGAVDISASRASFSNYGKCVDVYAPGVDVVSSWPGVPNLVNVLSGTSMACPHVTGIVAYAMAANASLARSPSLMKEWIRMAALPLPDGTLLVNNGVQADVGDHSLAGLGSLGAKAKAKREEKAIFRLVSDAARL